MNERRVRKVNGPLRASFRAAPSKSVTHRALVAAALADGPSTLLDPLDAEDTRATKDGLTALGLEVEAKDRAWHVHGGGGRVPGGGSLFLSDSGTSLRFLLAVAALGERPSILDGSARLRERPVQELALALVQLGGCVALGDGRGLPLEAGGAPLLGGALVLPGARSSQFASALLLVGPRLPRGLDLVLEPPAVSIPYIDLSAEVLAGFGATVERVADLRWRVEARGYAGREFRIEGDHSSASYFLAAPAVVGGRVRMEGLDPESRQPDARLCRILADLGCDVRVGRDWIEVEGSGRVPAFEQDLSEAPDLAPTLAVLALFAEGPCSMRGVAHLRFKESDRLAVLARNLELLGRPARAELDALEIGAPHGAALRGGRVFTASDHRIAMAFAVAGLRIEGLVLDDAACVGKSNPRFWEDFATLEGSSG